MDDFYHTNNIERIIGSEYDTAILGTSRDGNQPIYSMAKMVKILQKNESMNYYDAVDFITSNIGSYFEGENKPILLDDLQF